MGSHHKHRDVRQDGDIQIPNMLDPRIQRAMMGNAPPPGFHIHDRRLRTAMPAMLPSPLNGQMIVFPIGGLTDLEYAAITIAAGCPNLLPKDAVSRAQAVLAECHFVEPILDGEGRPIRRVGPMDWELIPQESDELAPQENGRKLPCVASDQ